MKILTRASATIKSKGLLRLLLPLVAGFGLLAFHSDTDEESVLISIDQDALPIVQKMFHPSIEKQALPSGVALINVSKKDLDALSAVMHQRFHRCGGFMQESSVENAVAALAFVDKMVSEVDEDLYRIGQEDVVRKVIADASESALRGTILSLSNFRNRYYTAPTGVDSQKWVADTWKKLTEGRSDVSIEMFKHPNWPQPSVIMTWKGTEKPEEIIVLGGHGDSIAGWFPREDVLAPGADDNASGIATITETIRLLAAHDFHPQRTIKFMSYSAEEVGLKGSKEIAEQFKRQAQKVLGVIQLDMTNFAGSSVEMALIDDNTNAAQNAFVKKLAETYIPEVKLGHGPCGYACSDHASWHRNGFPASFPFEAHPDERNQQIHTAQDTIALSENNAQHALPFAKLTTAYLIEISTVK